MLRTMAGVTTLVVALCSVAPASAGAREDRETLAAAALLVARQLLLAHGEFAPYGLGLEASKEVVDLTASSQPRQPGGDRPAQELRRAIAKAMESGRLDSAALVYEGTQTASGQRSEVVVLEFAHRDGSAAVVVYPYAFSDGELQFGEAQIVEQRQRPRSATRRTR